jgi:hypothetical protein
MQEKDMKSISETLGKIWEKAAKALSISKEFVREYQNEPYTASNFSPRITDMLREQEERGRIILERGRQMGRTFSETTAIMQRRAELERQAAYENRRRAAMGISDFSGSGSSGYCTSTVTYSDSSGNIQTVPGIQEAGWYTTYGTEFEVDVDVDLHGIAIHVVMPDEVIVLTDHEAAILSRAGRGGNMLEDLERGLHRYRVEMDCLTHMIRITNPCELKFRTFYGSIIEKGEMENKRTAVKLCNRLRGHDVMYIELEIRVR